MIFPLAKSTGRLAMAIVVPIWMYGIQMVKAHRITARKTDKKFLKAMAYVSYKIGRNSFPTSPLARAWNFCFCLKGANE